MILNAIQRSALPHPSGPLLQLQGDGVYSRDGRDVDLRLALDEPSPGVDTVEDLRSCIIFLHVDSVGILLSCPHINIRQIFVVCLTSRNIRQIFDSSSTTNEREACPQS